MNAAHHTERQALLAAIDAAINRPPRHPFSLQMSNPQGWWYRACPDALPDDSENVGILPAGDWPAFGYRFATYARASA
jgi:hypothetical protein